MTTLDTLDRDDLTPLRDVARDLAWDYATARRAATLLEIPLYRLPGDKRHFIRAADVSTLRRPIRLDDLA